MLDMLVMKLGHRKHMGTCHRRMLQHNTNCECNPSNQNRDRHIFVLFPPLYARRVSCYCRRASGKRLSRGNDRSGRIRLPTALRMTMHAGRGRIWPHCANGGVEQNRGTGSPSELHVQDGNAQAPRRKSSHLILEDAKQAIEGVLGGHHLHDVPPVHGRRSNSPPRTGPSPP